MKLIVSKKLSKCLQGKGSVETLDILDKSENDLKFTEIEVEYIKRSDERISPQTLNKRLKELKKTHLIKKENDKYKISEIGSELVDCLRRIDKKLK